eukprot:6489001-Amphidinium_carterae.1
MAVEQPVQPAETVVVEEVAAHSPRETCSVASGGSWRLPSSFFKCSPAPQHTTYVKRCFQNRMNDNIVSKVLSQIDVLASDDFLRRNPI